MILSYRVRTDIWAMRVLRFLPYPRSVSHPERVRQKIRIDM